MAAFPIRKAITTSVRRFVRANTNYQWLFGSVLDGSQDLTIATWFRSFDNSNAQSLCGVGRNGVSNHFINLVANGNVTDDPLRLLYRDGGASSSIASTAPAGYLVGKWAHALGTVSPSTGGRVRLNGGTPGTNGATRTPTLNRTTFGCVWNNSPATFLEGDLAEPAMWQAILEEHEELMLAWGVNPSVIRPDAQVGHWPFGLDENEPSFINDLTLTNEGSIFVPQGDLPVERPEKTIWIPSAASGVVSNIMDSRWDLFEAISNSIDARWNLNEEVYNSYDFRWHIYVEISNTLQAIWNIYVEISNTLQAIWNIFNDVSNTSTLNWNLLVEISNTSQIMWDIISSLSVISNTTDIRWNTIAEISNVLNTRWNIFSEIANTLDSRWDILNELGVSSDLRWNILNEIAQQLESKWNIFEETSNTVTVQWDSAGVVGNTVSIRWNIQTLQGILPVEVIVIPAEGRIVSVSAKGRIIDMH